MGAGTFIVAAGYAKTATIAVTCMCIGVAASGLMHSGYNVNMLDIAPRYACIIMGLTNTVGTITGFLSPMMVGFITVNKVSDLYSTDRPTVFFDLRHGPVSENRLTPLQTDAINPGLNLLISPLSQISPSLPLLKPPSLPPYS